MAATNVAGLVIDGLDPPLAPNAVTRARPSVDSIGRFCKVNAVTGMSIDDEQPVLGIEARGAVISHTALVGCNQASIGRGFLGGIWNRTALLIDSKPPVPRPERNRQKVLPFGPLHPKEVTLARRF